MTEALKKKECIVESLMLAGSSLVDTWYHYVIHVAFALLKNSTIKYLSLKSCSLRDEEIKLICKMLRRSRNLEKLDLSENLFTDYAIELLQRVVNVNKKLNVILITRNNKVEHLKPQHVEHQVTSYSKLPQEMLVYIGMFLSFRYWARASLICESMHNAMKSNAYWTYWMLNTKGTIFENTYQYQVYIKELYPVVKLACPPQEQMIQVLHSSGIERNFSIVCYDYMLYVLSLFNGCIPLHTPLRLANELQSDATLGNMRLVFKEDVVMLFHSSNLFHYTFDKLTWLSKAKRQQFFK